MNINDLFNFQPAEQSIVGYKELYKKFPQLRIIGNDFYFNMMELNYNLIRKGFKKSGIANVKLD